MSLRDRLREELSHPVPKVERSEYYQEQERKKQERLELKRRIKEIGLDIWLVEVAETLGMQVRKGRGIGLDELPMGVYRLFINTVVGGSNIREDSSSGSSWSDYFLFSVEIRDGELVFSLNAD